MKKIFDRYTNLILFISTFIFLIIIVGICEKIAASKNPIKNNGVDYVRYIRLREIRPLMSAKYEGEDIPVFLEDDPRKPKAVWLRADSEGFIIPSKIHDSPDLVLVFFGGSTTENIWLKETDRFPYVVGRLIEQKTNKKVNSYNSGVSGNSSMHSNFILLSKILPLKPDVAIMLHSYNDLFPFLIEERCDYWSDNYSRSLVVKVREKNHNWLRLLLKNIKDATIPNLYRAGQELMRPRVFDEWYIQRGKKVNIDDTLSKRAADNFRKSLKTFVTICKIWGIRPVLMTEPNRFKTAPDFDIMKDWEKVELSFGVKYEEFRQIYELFNDIIREVAKENDIFLIDLAKNFPQDKRYIHDVIHFTDKGSLLVAKIVSTELMKVLNSKNGK